MFETDEPRLLQREESDATLERLGSHAYGPEMMSHRAALWVHNGFERERERFRGMGPYVLFDTPGGREGLRRVVDPALHDLVDVLEPVEPPPLWSQTIVGHRFAGTALGLRHVFQRVHDRTGTLVGTTWLAKPLAGMSELASLGAAADLGHLDRMALVERPDRRPAAVLMADLEASSPLARRLSTARYFAFGRRLVRTADQCIVDHGGIVGRHAGDGIVAFFLAETAGSESAAARACIETARALRTRRRRHHPAQRHRGL